jgi:CubicO group peptidase (beta-lactamase class C family)
VPGAAVAILEHGEVTFAHGFGTKGPNSAEPVDANTLFRIGSMTKALTATALLGLVQSGKVSLDATLVSVVPDVAIDGGGDLARLTLRQLLSQQSGLYDYNVLNGPTEDAALSQFLTSASYAANEYFMDPPGTFWNYANANFYLAGLALERAGAVPYRKAVAERVLSPLGMTRTFFLPAEVLADGDFSDGKSTAPDGGPWDVAPDSYDNAWGRPDGYAFSSVLDYAKFMSFLYAGNPSVLADTEREAMQAPQIDTLEVGSAKADLESYGYGLLIDRSIVLEGTYYATKLVWHDGSLPGFYSEFLLIPSTGFGIVWLTNADGRQFGKSIALAIQSFAGLTHPTASAPSGVAVDPSLFSHYAGTYKDPHPVVGLVPHDLGLVTVAAKAGTLSIDVPAFDAAHTPYDKTLQPTTRDNFVLTAAGTPIPVTFVADGAGAYVWLRTREAVAARVSGDGGAGP